MIEQRALGENWHNGVEQTYSDFFSMVESSDLGLYIQAFNSTRLENLQHIILSRVKHLLVNKRTTMTSEFIQGFTTNYFTTCYGKVTPLINRVYIELLAKMFVLFCKDFTLSGNQLNIIKGLVNPENMIKADYDHGQLNFVVDFNYEVIDFLRSMGKDNKKEAHLRSLKEVFFTQFLTNVLEQTIIVIEFLIYKFNRSETADKSTLHMFIKTIDTYINILTSQADIQTKEEFNIDDIFEINESCTAFTIPIKSFRNNEFWGKIIKSNFIENLMNLLHRSELQSAADYPQFVIIVLKVFIVAASANLNYFVSVEDRANFISVILNYLSLVVMSSTILERIEQSVLCIYVHQLISLAVLKCFLFHIFKNNSQYTQKYTELITIITMNYLRTSKAKVAGMDDVDLKNLLYYLTHVQNIEKTVEKQLLGESVKDFFLIIIMKLLSKLKEELKDRNDFSNIYESMELLVGGVSFNLTSVAQADITSMVAELVLSNDIQQISLFIMLMGKVTTEILNLDNMQLASTQFYVLALQKFIEILNMILDCSDIKSNQEAFIFFVANKTMFEVFKKFYKSPGVQNDVITNELVKNSDDPNNFMMLYLRLVNQTISLGLESYKELLRVALYSFGLVFKTISMNKFNNVVTVGRIESSSAIITNAQVLLNSHFVDCNLTTLNKQPSEISIYYELATRLYCQFLIMNFDRDELVNRFRQFIVSIKSIPTTQFNFLCKVIDGVLNGIQGSWFNEILYDELIAHFINAIVSTQISVNNKVLKLMANLTGKRFLEKLSVEKKIEFQTVYPNLLSAISVQVRDAVSQVELSKDLNMINKVFIVPLKRFLQIMNNLFENFKPSREDLELLWSCFDQVFLSKLDLNVVQIYVNELREIFYFISHFVVKDQSLILITKKTSNYMNLLYVIYSGMETLNVSSYINTLDYTIKNIQHHVTLGETQFLVDIYIETGLLVKIAKIGVNDLFSRNLGQEVLLVNLLYTLWIVDTGIFGKLASEIPWAKKQLEFFDAYACNLNANTRILRLKHDNTTAVLDAFLNSIN